MSDDFWCTAHVEEGARPASGLFVTKTQPLTGTASLFWPVSAVLDVAFMNGSAVEQDRVLQIAGTWSEHANVRFSKVENTTGAGPDIRIEFDTGGHSSQLGTNSLAEISRGNRSMRYATFAPANRPILHEFGHALGLQHEHLNPDAGFDWDKQAVYDFAQVNFGWDKDTTDFNILDPLERDSLNYSEFDAASIMGYHVRPSWTRDDAGTVPALELSPTDISYIGDWYPFGPAIAAARVGSTERVLALASGASKRMFQHLWDGSGWKQDRDWDLSLEGKITGTPAIASAVGTRDIDVIARREGDGSPVLAHYDGAEWTGWTDLGSTIGGSPLMLAARDTLWCFVRDAQGRPAYKMRERGTWDRTPAGWVKLGGTITGEIAGHVFNDQVIALAARNDRGHAVIKWSASDRWQPGLRQWVDLEADIAGRPAVVVHGSEIHVVARFAGDTLHHLIFDWKRSRIKQGWERLPIGMIGGPTLVAGEGDEMFLLLRTADQQPVMRRYVGGSWENWVPLGGRSNDTPAGLFMPDKEGGALHVFVAGASSNGGFHKTIRGGQILPSATGWTRLGGKLDWRGV